MQSNKTSVTEYIASLPEEQQAVIKKVRSVIKKHLPKGYTEIMQYGMIGYAVPLKLYPEGYLSDKKTPLPYAALAAQKNYYSLYLMCIYGNEDVYAWFRKEYEKSGKKLNMGKSCVRFKTLNDLPLPLIGKAIAKVPVKKCIAMHETARSMRKRK